MQKNRPGVGYRFPLVLVAIALAAACASKPAPQPLRTYDHIQLEQLFLLTRTVFTNAGFQTGPCHAARVCIETPWKEYDGEKRGAVAARERRMYTARYVIDPQFDQYMLFLDLAVQERAPGASAWTDRAVDPASDAEYLRILQAIDQGVKKLGGVQR
jgi:hypothetical protein